MVCTGSHVFVGDSVGALRAFKMKFTNNLLQLAALGSAHSHPYGAAAPIAGIDIRTYSNTCKGQAVVVSYVDSTLAIFKLALAVHNPLSMLHKLKVVITGTSQSGIVHEAGYGPDRTSSESYLVSSHRHRSTRAHRHWR